jgi:hypothetical protein
MHHDGQEETPYQQKSCWRKADIWLDGEVGSGVLLLRQGCPLYGRFRGNSGR